MILRRLSLSLSLAAAAATAQTTIQVTVTGPRNSQSKVIRVKPSIVISSLQCPVEVFEGDPTTCTVTLDKPAPAGGVTLEVKGAVSDFSVFIPQGAAVGKIEFTAPPIPVADSSGIRQGILAFNMGRSESYPKWPVQWIELVQYFYRIK